MAGGGSLELLWHLLRLESQLIISQKARKNARYYRCILRKIDFPGGGALSICTYRLLGLTSAKQVGKLLDIISSFSH